MVLCYTLFQVFFSNPSPSSGGFVAFSLPLLALPCLIATAFHFSLHLRRLRDRKGTWREQLRTFFNILILFTVNFSQITMNVANNNCMTDCISHLNEDAKGNSIVDGCFAKTERSTMIRSGQIGSGESRNMAALSDCVSCFMRRLNDLEEFF